MSMDAKYARLPDPWYPLTQWGLTSKFISGWASGITTATWAEGANDALYVPVVFPCDATLYALYALGGNATGNYDLGLYDHEMRLIASKGTTALAAGTLTLTLPEFRVIAGRPYWCALALSSGSGSVWRVATGGAAHILGTQIATEASAVPLPSVMTPAKPASTLFPIFAFGVR